jgi:hypothetical protein
MFNYLDLFMFCCIKTKHSTTSLVIIILVCILDPQCFCCTTLRDVIIVEGCSASVISTTCILQHAVVCWVTAAGIRAIALTLCWKPSKGIEPVGV